MKRLTQSAIALAVMFCFALIVSQGICASVKGKELAGKVNINTATAEELTLLPRVGPKIAERIISFRTSNGQFKKVDDLKQVKGIGEKTFSRMASLIKVSGKTDLHLVQ